MRKFEVVFVFILLILFEIALYISIKEKFEAISHELKSVNTELEELHKTQRLIAQDAELATRLAIESAGEKNEQ